MGMNDLISRQLVKEQMIKYGFRSPDMTVTEFVEDLQPTCNQLANDCIDRQAAIHIASGYCHPANIAAELSKLPPIQPEQRWIPCSERLPDYDEKVLTCCESGSVEIQRLEKGYYWEAQYGGWTTDLYEVIAWMPLPEPYEPQKSEVDE